jgi:hypothetical protein
MPVETIKATSSFPELESFLLQYQRLLRQRRYSVHDGKDQLRQRNQHQTETDS